MNNLRGLIIALTVLPACISTAGLSQPATPEPQTVLKKVIAQYERASSYQDSGEVRIISSSDGRITEPLPVASQSTFISFSTRYRRPSMFRFEWRSPDLTTSREAVIWSDGKQTYRWMPYESRGKKGFFLEDVISIKLLINDSMRSSGGAAYTISSLLMKDVAYSSFAEVMTSMTSLSILREEEFDGEQCYVIEGLADGIPWVFWVGKTSYLLRKIRTVYTLDSFHKNAEKGQERGGRLIAEEIHRNIKINTDIPDSFFKSKPRLQAGDIDFTR